MLSLIIDFSCSPSFVALHFKGHSHRPIDRMYDMPRFYNLTGLRAVPLDRFKGHNLTAASVKPDRVTCWTYAAYSNPKATYLPPPARFLSEYGISLDYSWPDPQTLSTPVGQQVWVKDIVAFLANGTGQAGWIERNRVELLPEAPSPAFDPAGIPPRSPDEQVHCVDALYYLKSQWPSTWGDVGQHLHFLPEVQTAAHEYLRVLLEVLEGQDIPPYISVHVCVLQISHKTRRRLLTDYPNLQARYRLPDCAWLCVLFLLTLRVAMAYLRSRSHLVLQLRREGRRGPEARCQAPQRLRVRRPDSFLDLAGASELHALARGISRRLYL